MAGHLSGIVGCDFNTGRTGSGWMVAARGGGGGAGVAEVAKPAC
ncbi:hypothetical protein [Mycobacterium numidiamassiliense]|nr:hypothetical protein [Mycobacterium numidiamassiliense]